MFKRVGVFIAFFIVLAYVWLINSVSVFGEKYPVTEVYSSFSSSAPIKTFGNFSYAIVLTRCGEGFTAKEDFNLKDFLSEMKAETVFTESGEEIFSVYAFTPEIDNFIKIDGKKINLHISKNMANGSIKVASPIIFGSF